MLKNADPEFKGGSADSFLMIIVAAEHFCRQLGNKSSEIMQSSGKIKFYSIT